MAWFREEMPAPETELNYSTPFELLVAVILSAQCTDVRVNIITPALFEKYGTADKMAESTPEELFPFISSCTYPKSKSERLAAMAKMLSKEFNSVIPQEIEELQKLPGVGRKTANVVASVLYDKPVIAVDTHVFRVSRRIGLSNGKTVDDVERDLTRHIKEEERAIAHHWLILHGRYICVARSPKCDKCQLTPFCRFYHKSGRADLNKGGAS